MTTWGMPGGDPGPGGMRGGLPQRRLDQQYNPPAPPGPVGGAAGIVRARLVIVSGAGVVGVFVYNGTPGPGNPPIVSITSASTDPFGNPVTPGIDITQGSISGPVNIMVGQPGGSSVSVLPNVNTPLNITTAIAGIIQAAVELTTTDGAEVLPGLLGSVLLGAGAAAKMATVLTSPFGSAGAALVLEATNDGGTDTPVITLGTVTTPDSSTEVFSPLLTVTPFALLVYAASGAVTVTTKTAGSGTIPVPAGVTVGRIQCWGPSGGGCGGIAASGEPGGGSGEYAEEPSGTLTPLENLAYVVGAAGSAGAGTGGPGGPGRRPAR